MTKVELDDNGLQYHQTVNYCQAPSDWFIAEIDEDQGDWRSTRGRLAIETGCDPDSRCPVPIGGKIEQ